MIQSTEGTLCQQQIQQWSNGAVDKAYGEDCGECVKDGEAEPRLRQKGHLMNENHGHKLSKHTKQTQAPNPVVH